jgi:hypothetical protein
VSRGYVLTDLNRCALTAARADGRVFNGDWAMTLRELHVAEGKFAVASADPCDERVVRHIRFPRESLKDSCLNATGKFSVGNSSWQQLTIF